MASPADNEEYLDSVIEQHSEGVRLERVKLTDGSVAWNVLLSSGASELRLACVSERRALALAEALGECAWFEER